MKKQYLIFSIIFLLIISVSLNARVLVVDQVNGPYYTPSEAANVAVEGDTIYITAGKYLNTSYIPYKVDIVGESKEQVILVSDANYPASRIMRASGGNIISNITFLYDGAENAPVVFTDWDGPAPTPTYITDCQFLYGFAGVVLGNYNNSTFIERCHFEGLTDGIVFRSSDANLSVYDCTFTDCQYSLLLGSSLSGNISIINNTFTYNNYITYFYNGYNSLSMDFINNIVYNNNGGVDFKGASITNDYNDYFGNGVDVTGFSKGANTILDDPLMYDPANGDYRIDSSSVCLGGGSPDYLYTSVSSLVTVKLIGAGYYLTDAVLSSIIPPEDISDTTAEIIADAPPVSAIARLKSLKVKVHAIYEDLDWNFEKHLFRDLVTKKIDKFITELDKKPEKLAKIIKKLNDLSFKLERYIERLDRDQTRKKPIFIKSVYEKMRSASVSIIDELNSTVKDLEGIKTA